MYVCCIQITTVCKQRSTVFYVGIRSYYWYPCRRAFWVEMLLNCSKIVVNVYVHDVVRVLTQLAYMS